MSCWIQGKAMVAVQGTESPEAQKIQDSKMTYFCLEYTLSNQHVLNVSIGIETYLTSQFGV